METETQAQESDLTGEKLLALGAARMRAEEAKDAKRAQLARDANAQEEAKAKPEGEATEEQEAEAGGEETSEEEGSEEDKPKKKPKPISQEWSALNDKKRKFNARVEAETARIAAEREEVRTLARQAVEQFGVLAKAKEHWEAGDAEAACKAAFGVSAAEFNKQLLKEHHQRDPKVVELERKLEARERAEREAQERAQAEQSERAAREMRTEYVKNVGAALARSSDQLVAKMGADVELAELVVLEQEASGWDGQKFGLSLEQAQAKVAGKLKRLFAALQPSGAESDPDGEESLESAKGRQESPTPKTTTSVVRRHPRNRTASASNSGEWDEEEWRRRTLARLKQAQALDQS